MKTIIFGVSAFVTMLIIMYYRKQQTIKNEIVLEEMKRPQLNVVPQNVTSHLLETLEALAKTFETKIEPDRRKYRILINSSERNTGLYPTPTDYQLQLPETIYGMEKISLQKAVFPMTLDLINTNNRTLVINVDWNVQGSVDYNLSLPTGNYTVTSLATAIQDELNAVGDGSVWDVTIDTTSLLLSITVVTPRTGNATGLIRVTAASSNYLLAILGMEQMVGTPSPPSPTGSLTGTDPVNVAFPCNLLIYLDNKSMEFNSLRIMKSAEIDSRCFANFNMPSGNGVYGGTPSVGTVNGDAILVQGTSGVSGLGTYTVTKDMTNAYYKAYEGAIPSVRYINVRIKQLLPDGSVVTPDFNGANHSMEFEMKARVDKTSLTASN
jgi:hypothetical protein